MSEKQSLLPVKSDFVFKLIFGDQRNVDILACFLKSVLDIPDEEYGRLTIVDPHVKKEALDDKHGVLDVKVHTLTGSIVHVEIQLWPMPEMEGRAVYYQSKLVTEQMSSGQNYSVIKRVVTIKITDYVIVPENREYHNQFRYRSDKGGVEFTNLTEIDTLELPKLPPDGEGSELWCWLKFIKSDDRRVLDMLAQRSPQMEKAVGVLMELSADQRTRMLYEEREKTRRDVESLVGGARAEGIHEGHVNVARNLLTIGMPIDAIIQATELSREEIEGLR